MIDEEGHIVIAIVAICHCYLFMIPAKHGRLGCELEEDFYGSLSHAIYQLASSMFWAVHH
jgi:hypothetical protein